MEAVHIKTKEEYNLLMKEFAKKGYYWENNVPATDLNIYSSYKEETCIKIWKELNFCFKRFYQNMWYTILTFNEYMERENKDTFAQWEEVLVSDDGKSWEKGIYIATVKWNISPYICVSHYTVESYKNWKEFYIIQYKQIKKIEETVTITLSKSDHEKVKSLLNI